MSNIRLSKFVTPERYQLSIKPDLNGFTFEGSEVIFLSLEKSANQITLHAKELKITDVHFNSTKAKKVVYNSKAETATFTFAKALPKGKGELKLEFKGV